MTNKYFAKSLSAPKNIKITKGAKITKAGFWDTMPYITEPEPVVRGASAPVDYVPTSLTGAPEERMRGLAETPRIRSLVGGPNQRGVSSWNDMGPRVSPQFLGAAPRSATAPIRNRPLTTGIPLRGDISGYALPDDFGLAQGRLVPQISIPDQMRQPISGLPLASRGRRLKVRSVDDAQIQRAIDSQVGGRDPIFSRSNGQYTDLLGRTYAPDKNGVLRLNRTNAAQSRFSGNQQLRFQRETRRNIDGLLKVNEDLQYLQANPPTTDNLYDIQEHSRAIRDLTSQRKQLETTLQGRNITVPRPKDMKNLTPQELRARLFAAASAQPKGRDTSLAGVSRITTPRMQGIRGVDASGNPVDAPSLPYLDRPSEGLPHGRWVAGEKARLEALKNNPMFGMADDMAGIPDGSIRGASSPVDVPIGRNSLDDALSAMYLSNGGQIPEGMFPLPDEPYKSLKEPRRTTRGARSPVDEMGLRELNSDAPSMPRRQPTPAEIKAGFLAPFVASKQPSRPPRGARGQQASVVNSAMDSAFDEALMRDADPTSRFVVGSDRPKTLQDYVDTGAISPSQAETIRTTRGASAPVESSILTQSHMPMHVRAVDYNNIDKPSYRKPQFDAIEAPLNGPWESNADYLTQFNNNVKRTRGNQKPLPVSPEEPPWKNRKWYGDDGVHDWMDERNAWMRNFNGHRLDSENIPYIVHENVNNPTFADYKPLPFDYRGVEFTGNKLHDIGYGNETSFNTKSKRTTRGASSPVDAIDKPLYTSPIYRDENANPLHGPWLTAEDYKTQGINNGRRDYWQRLARGEQPVQTRVRGASSPIDIKPSTSSTRSVDSLGRMARTKPNRDNALLGRLMDNKPVRGTYSQEVNTHLLDTLLRKPSQTESIMERVGRRASGSLEHVGSAINKLPRWAKLGAALAAGVGVYQLGKMNKSMAKQTSKPVLKTVSKTMSKSLSTSTNKSMLKSKHSNKYL